MTDQTDQARKNDKKLAKADAKTSKKQAKAAVKATSAVAIGSTRLPSGVAIDVREAEGGAELVISGLSDSQMETIAPHVAREVLIAVTAEKSTIRAAFMRFVREGIFQTIVKVLAGLIVAWVLIKFGFAK